MAADPISAIFGRPIPRRQAISFLLLGMGGLIGVSACRPGPLPATTSPATPATVTTAPVAAVPPVATRAPAEPEQQLRLLFWQAPTILNPHLTRSGAADIAAARCCFEPLLTADDTGRLIPVLAADVPSVENGGLPDARTVVYRLRPNVTWADGQPFSADDVVFTYQFVADPQTAATTGQNYQLVERVEAIDPLTVRVTFQEPTAGWHVPFVGKFGMILPRHALQADIGAGARSAPFNQRPFGTGPYLVEEFRPGDVVSYVANPHYREAGRPFFRRMTLKGGGDQVTAARTVLQTGEYDFAPFLQLETDILEDLDRSLSSGRLLLAPGVGVELVFFNQADPNQEIDGERSHPSTRHPFLTDPQVRAALELAIDRPTIIQRVVGRAGEMTANVLSRPPALASATTHVEYDIDRANQMLDARGYARGGDGIRRTPGGARMQMVFTTIVSGERQKIQAIIKDGWQKIGVETEIRALDPTTFLAGPDNPASAYRFPADVQMSLFLFSSPFPTFFMRRYYAGANMQNWAQKSNNWTGLNLIKWFDPEYDRLYEQVLAERDPGRSQMLWQRLNDLVVQAHAVIPVVERKFIMAVANGLTGPAPRVFDSETWNIAEWRR